MNKDQVKGEVKDIAGKIQEEAKERNLITILWLYPVSKEMLSWENFTANACRLGLELGADMVKIKYPGSKEELKKARKYFLKIFVWAKN